MNLPEEAHVSQLEREIMTHLRADERCSGVQIFSARDKSIETKLRTQMGQRFGIVMILYLGSKNCSNNNLRTVQFSDQRISVHCAENPIYNRAAGKLQLPADVLAEYVVKALYQFRPPCLGGSKMLLTDTPTVEPLDHPKYNVYAANFKTP